MPQYLLSVYMVEGAEVPSPETQQQMFEGVDRFNTKLQAEGAWVFAGGLHPAETATVVDARGAEPIITDGPFAEAKEQIGGFGVIEAADLDAALTWAREGSAACLGPVEVRPFQTEEEGEAMVEAVRS
jgi:hypothetical protein